MEDDVKRLDIEKKPTKEELIDMLDEMAKNYDMLPTAAMLHPVTHYDLGAALILIATILRQK